MAAQLPAWVGCEASRSWDFNTSYSYPLNRFDGRYIARSSQSDIGQDLKISESVIMVNEYLLRLFRDYLLSRFSKSDARQRFNYFRRFWYVVYDPMVITKLTPSQARKLLLGLAAYRDFCRLYNVPFNADLRGLRRLAPKESKVRVLNMEVSHSIVEVALSELSKLPSYGAWRVLGLTAFFTGLRSTEIVFMVKNWGELGRVIHRGAVIVELGYERKSKKAWVTVMPMRLSSLIEELDKGSVGINVFKDCLLYTSPSPRDRG